MNEQAGLAAATATPAVLTLQTYRVWRLGSNYESGEYSEPGSVTASQFPRGLLTKYRG